MRDTAGSVLTTKTSLSHQSAKEIGWYIGYIETKNDVFYFANCVQIPSQNMAQADLVNKFVASRKAIALGILKELKIIDTN
jgi:beta-lactamase class D